MRMHLFDGEFGKVIDGNYVVKRLDAGAVERVIAPEQGQSFRAARRQQMRRASVVADHETGVSGQPRQLLEA